MRKLFTPAVVSAALLLGGCPRGPGPGLGPEGDPPEARGSPDERSPAEVDVSHVRPGQRYVYRLAGVEQQYTVLALEGDAIRCSFALLGGGRAAPASEVVIPVAPPAVEAGRDALDGAGAGVTIETVVVGEVSFRCRVIERDGVRSWLSPRWTPRGIRVTQGEEEWVRLVRIEEP